MRRSQLFRSAGRLSVITLLVGGTVASAGSLALAGGGSFTAGDLVVDQVTEASGGPSSTAGTVSLVDYSTSGAPSGFSVTMPTSNSGSGAGSTHALVDSGTATNDGLITLSGDGQYIYVPGYDAAPGTASITSASNTGRTVGIVSGSGVSDTSTALTDSATEGQNFRSATGPTGGTSNFYDAGGAGLGYITDAATSNNLIDTTDNKLHQVQIVNGNLYASTTKNIIEWSGEPTSGPVTGANIIPSPPSGFNANGFAFVTLGAGPAFDTLYVADTGANQVEKYSLEGSPTPVWTLNGTVSVVNPTGLVVNVTASQSGGPKVADIYITNAPAGSGNTYCTQISELTDSSGPYTGTTGSGMLPSATTVNLLATAGTSSSFHGLTFAPTGSPAQNTPETSMVVLLPALGALVFGGGYIAYRRRPRIA